MLTHRHAERGDHRLTRIDGNVAPWLDIVIITIVVIVFGLVRRPLRLRRPGGAPLAGGVLGLDHERGRWQSFDACLHIGLERGRQGDGDAVKRLGQHQTADFQSAVAAAVDHRRRHDPRADLESGRKRHGEFPGTSCGSRCRKNVRNQRIS